MIVGLHGKVLWATWRCIGSDDMTLDRATSQRLVGRPQKPLRGILVGCGYISNQQLDAWNQVPNAEIVCLVDSNNGKALHQAAKFGINSIHVDLASALVEHEVDFVDIATPPQTHVELVRTSADAGAHILCQKPLAPTIEEVDEMIGIANGAGVRLIANENMRFQAWFLKMKDILDSGSLGQPMYFRWTNRSRSTLPTVTFANQPYFASMPRLVIYELGIHFFDTMRYFFGEPLRLVASIGKASSEIAGEDSAVVLIDYDNLVAIMDISWASIPTHSKKDAVSWAIATIEGEKGTMHLSIDGRLRVITDDDEEVFKFGPDTINDSFTAMQNHFIQCLVANVGGELSGPEYRKTMELVFGSYLSAATHEVYHVGDELPAPSR